MSTPSSGRWAPASVAAAAVLWSTSGLFIKVAPMPALAVVFGRSLIAAIFYLAILRTDLKRARWTSALAYAGMIFTFVTATKLTTAANAIFLQYTGPAYVLILAPLLLGESFGRIDAICVGLSLAGMTLFFVGKIEPGQALGNALGVASGVFFAFAVVLLRRDARDGGDALASTTLGNLIAAAVALPFLVYARPSFGGGQGLLVLLYLGIFQIGVSYWMFARGLRHVHAAPASLLSMLEPVLNPVWVWLGAGERPTHYALLGGTVVVLAVLLRTGAGLRNRAVPSAPPNSAALQESGE